MAIKDLDPDTMQQLLWAMSQKDEKAFKAFFDLFRLALHPFVWNLLRDEHLTEEVIADALLAAWEGADQFKGQAKVSTWVYQIARFKAMDALRARARQPQYGAVPLDDPDVLELPDTTPWADVLAVVDRRQAQLRLDECIGKLSEEQRLAVTLVRMEELTAVQAAHALGIAEGTVKSRLFAANAALRKCLSRWYEEMKSV